MVHVNSTSRIEKILKGESLFNNSQFENIVNHFWDNVEQVIGVWPEQFGEPDNDERDNIIDSSCYYRNDIDASYHISKAQTEYNEQSYERMIESFMQDYETGLDEFDHDSLSEQLQNDFQEYENEWFQPALLMLSVFTDANNDLIVELLLSYKDAPYHRLYYFETLVYLTYQDHKTATPEKILKDLIEGMKNV